MYFARYDNRKDSTIEISALTNASKGEIESLFLMNGDFKRVEIEPRGNGSHEHAHAYRMIQNMPVAVIDDSACWLKLADVLHWACNMYGFDYGREMRFYNFAAFNIAHMLIQREEKALTGAKPQPGDRLSKPRQSAGAAVGKASAKARSTPAESGRR